MNFLRDVPSMFRRVRRSAASRESGVAMVEYALVVSGVVIFVLACITLFSGKILDLLDGITF